MSYTLYDITDPNDLTRYKIFSTSREIGEYIGLTDHIFVKNLIQTQMCYKTEKVNYPFIICKDIRNEQTKETQRGTIDKALIKRSCWEICDKVLNRTLSSKIYNALKVNLNYDCFDKFDPLYKLSKRKIFFQKDGILISNTKTLVAFFPYVGLHMETQGCNGKLIMTYKGDQIAIYTGRKAEKYQMATRETAHDNYETMADLNKIYEFVSIED